MGLLGVNAKLPPGRDHHMIHATDLNLVLKEHDNA